VGFTLPSALLMVLFALGISNPAHGALHGLKVVAVAVVAQAVWGMARTLCPDASRVTFMAIAASATLLAPFAWMQGAVIVVAGVVGVMLFRPALVAAHEPLPIRVGRRSGALWLTCFFALLVALPLLANSVPNHTLAVVDAFYRSGALVFGGGHLVLPLLQAQVVPVGWVSNETFLAGYGAAQALPGPLFSFSAFLGASMSSPPTGWLGALICLVAIFAPSFLLVAGVLPFWENIRRNLRMQAALQGINAAVVGLLLAALFDPVWTSAIHQPRDVVLALVALVALMVWRLPPWLVVIASGLCGWVMSVGL
jgi:chromate transporter